MGCGIAIYSHVVHTHSRYAVSVLWRMDAHYQVKDVWFGRTVIRSSYKLAYEVRPQNKRFSDVLFLLDMATPIDPLYSYTEPSQPLPP